MLVSERIPGSVTALSGTAARCCSSDALPSASQSSTMDDTDAMTDSLGSCQIVGGEQNCCARIAVPLAASSPKRSLRRRALRGSSPFNGSSRINTCGECKNLSSISKNCTSMVKMNTLFTSRHNLTNIDASVTGVKADGLRISNESLLVLLEI